MTLRFPFFSLYLGHGTRKPWGTARVSEQVALVSGGIPSCIWMLQGKVSICVLHITQCLCLQGSAYTERCQVSLLEQGPVTMLFHTILVSTPLGVWTGTASQL